MKGDLERRAARAGRAPTIISVIVGLAVAVTFGLLYASTPPTVVAVDGGESVKQK